MGVRKNKFGLPLCALLIACSLGIYQGYVPVTISLFVLLLIKKALQGELQFVKLVQRGFYYCFALILGLALYLLFLNISLAIYDTALSDYNGMNQMGKLTLEEIPTLIYEAFYYFCMMPFKDYCGLANLPFLKIAYIALAVLAVCLLGYLLFYRIRKPLIVIFSALMCLVFPIAVNFVVIMSPDAWIYTLMLYAFVLIPCVPIVIHECLPENNHAEIRLKSFSTKCLVTVIAVLILGYGYSANINYTAVYFSNRQVENYVASMVAQIRMTEGFDSEKKWVFLGEPEDPLLRPVFDYELSYGGAFSTERTLENYSRAPWILHYVGYLPQTATEAEIKQIASMDVVKQMPCWPSYGAIRVVEDKLVVKFENLLEIES